MQKERPFLPEFTSEEHRESYFATKAKEKFTDERKHYFSESEINEKARESSMSGGEILGLKDIVKLVQDLCKKGSEEAIVIEIPQTAGIDALEATRKFNDLQVRKGYEVIEETVYGFVDEERGTMRYFTPQCIEVEERERPLSAKEKREYLGLFATLTQKPTESEFLAATGTDDEGLF